VIEEGEKEKRRRGDVEVYEGLSTKEFVTIELASDDQNSLVE